MVQIPPGDWLSVDEVVRMLRVSRRRVQTLAKKKLKSVLWMGRYLIDRVSAEAYRDSPREVGRPPNVKLPEPPAKKKGRRP